MVSFPDKPGIYERGSSADEMRYALSIPADFNRSVSHPLVLVLHWGGPAVPYRGEAILTGLALPALEPLGAIIAAPDCPDVSWMTARSEIYLLELLDELEQAYSIDNRRRLITGYSMGAEGTWYMAARHPERFSAAIAISTTPPEEMLQVAWHLPLYIIHSRQDEHFPLEFTRQVVEQLRNRGVEVVLVILEGATHFDVPAFIEPLSEALPWIEQVWSTAEM